MDFKKILLPTDFSRPAMQLLDCLDEFQALGLEEVVLVHVIDERTERASRAYKGIEMALLESQKKSLESLGLKVKVLIPIAIPNLEITKIAKDEEVSMIVIPSHGQGFIKNIYLGSTTKDVIRVSGVPILIEKYQDVDNDRCRIRCLRKFRKVLLTLDFSIHSNRLIDEIAGLAHLIDEVILLTVIERAIDNDDLVLKIKDRQMLISDAKQLLNTRGLKVQTLVHQGDAATDIMAVAEQENASLIILGKHGGSLFKELVLGSTAYDVARRSELPVLLIPVAE